VGAASEAMQTERDGPLVSIVLPVYNGGDYLRDSVRSILEQTYRNLELIVVDDGSTDGCMEEVARLSDERIRSFRQENAGRAAALNLGLDHARGSFYATQDADDLSHPRRVERLVQVLREQPDVAAVFSGHDLLLGDRRVAPLFADRDRDACARAIEAFAMPSHDPTAMFRLEMVGDLRYEPSLRIGAAFDYILRVGERWPMLVLGECLYTYRVHPGSATRNVALRQESIRRVLERAFERRGMSHPPADPSGPRDRNRDLDNNLVAHFLQSVLDLRRVGRWREALGAAWQCHRLHPADPYYAKPLLYAVAPLRPMEWLRERYGFRARQASRLPATRSGAGVPNAGER
jgi:glycosyltransferase involved in cell wall biosynthesis